MLTCCRVEGHDEHMISHGLRTPFQLDRIGNYETNLSKDQAFWWWQRFEVIGESNRQFRRLFVAISANVHNAGLMCTNVDIRQVQVAIIQGLCLLRKRWSMDLWMNAIGAVQFHIVAIQMSCGCHS